VIGSHGRGGLAHATVGDTAAELLNSIPCDVFVARSDESAAAAEHGRH
jgi:nucleotide-binding universal stress UspA family protein